MGGSKKQAELRLFLPVDEATLKRSIEHFHRMEREEDSLRAATTKRIQSSRDGLAAYVKNLKAESIVSAEAARETTEHAKALEKADQAAKKAATSQDFYNRAVRNQYGSQRALLTGGAPRGMASAAGGGRASTAISALASALPGGAGGIARQVGDFARLGEELSKAGGAAGGLSTSLGGLAVAGPLAIAAVVGVGIAWENFTKQLNEAQANLDSAYNAQVDYYRLIKTGTSEEIQAKLDALIIEKEARELANRDLINATERATAALGPFKDIVLKIADGLGIGPFKDINASEKEIREFGYEINALREALKNPAVKARDAAEAAKKQAQESEKLARASKEAAKAQEQQTEAQQKAAQAAQQLQTLYQGIVEHGRQAAQQLAKTEDQRLKDILALNQRYAQQARDEAKQQQRQINADARRAAHEERRAEIEGRLAATKLTADRDFAGLADLREQKVVDDALKVLDDEFNAQEKLISEREAAEDKAVQYARDRAAIDQRVNEARISAAQTELEYMRQVVAEFAKLRGGFGDPRFYNESQIRAVYGAAAGAAGAASLDPSKVKLRVPTRRANGGWLNPGQLSTYNEIPGQSEAFGGHLLPGGMGMIWPAQGGHVTNHNGGNKYTFNISGSNPQEIWRQIERKLNERDRRTYGG